MAWNLTEMKNRGIQDILIACSDNLNGMSEAIGAVFKSLYLAIDYMTKKWSMPIPNWNKAMAHFFNKI
ncbi:transposase [Rickettsia felis]|uniref:transposase n=1 Tax=Rickettsia felis TaxID=42862 RepID=UPI000A763EA6|nr:transposase [Rickettsia felis]